MVVSESELLYFRQQRHITICLIVLQCLAKNNVRFAMVDWKLWSKGNMQNEKTANQNASGFPFDRFCLNTEKWKKLNKQKIKKVLYVCNFVPTHWLFSNKQICEHIWILVQTLLVYFKYFKNMAYMFHETTTKMRRRKSIGLVGLLSDVHCLHCLLTFAPAERPESTPPRF